MEASFYRPLLLSTDRARRASHLFKTELIWYQIFIMETEKLKCLAPDCKVVDLSLG